MSFSNLMNRNVCVVHFHVIVVFIVIVLTVSHFYHLLNYQRAYIDQIRQKASLDEGIQVSNKGSRLFKTGVSDEIAKIHFVLQYRWDRQTALKFCGTENNQYINGLTLELTNQKTRFPVYYLSLRARNGAGVVNSSPKVSTPIIVVEEDKADMYMYICLFP